jgi:hypothetical protein
VQGTVRSKRSQGGRRWRVPAVALMLLLAVASGAGAQDFNVWQAHEGRFANALRYGLPDYRGGFTFCRLQYTSVRSEEAGLGWSTDYPRGDQNLMIRLSQLTNTHLSLWEDHTPGHTVVKATDPELFKCPFLFTSDVGTVGFSDEEVASLRKYFQKGGVLWVDDFWGSAAWAQWSMEIGRVLPDYPIVDLTPDHPLMSLIYKLDAVPQIPNIGFWRRTNGETRERGEDSERAHLRAIFDERGRLMVIMTFNTDIADGWEREGESDEFFALFSPHAYGLGVNIAVWIMGR